MAIDSRYTIGAYYPKFQGIQFRSMLEKRWAQFFDHNGYQWEYIDAPYGDFRVDGHLVEVKPRGEEFLQKAVGMAPQGQSWIIQDGPGFHTVWSVHLSGCTLNLREVEWIGSLEI